MCPLKLLFLALACVCVRVRARTAHGVARVRFIVCLPCFYLEQCGSKFCVHLYWPSASSYISDEFMIVSLCLYCVLAVCV